MWRDGRPEYMDVCHPRKGEPHKYIVLWVHDGSRVESRSAKFGKEHDDGSRISVYKSGVGATISVQDNTGIAVKVQVDSVGELIESFSCRRSRVRERRND